MKNILFVLVLFFSCFSFAQNWVWQNPLPQGKTLNDVQILNSNYFFAVGDFGSFIKSVDGGLSWSIVNTGKLYNLNAVYALSESNIWIACDGGRLLHTQDGGNNFLETQFDSADGINDLIFIDNLNGYAIGNNGLFIKSNDGGLTWVKQPVFSNTSFSKIFYYNNKLYAIGESGTLLISTDDGINWTSIALTNNILTDINAVNNNIFAAGQNGTILKSIDNGATFSKLTTTFTNWIQSIKFFDDNNGIAVGYPGVILTTSDGGLTWTKNEAGKLFKLNSIALDNSSTWIVGERGMILHTSDRGLTFEFKSSGKYSKINDIYFFTENTGVVVGNDGLILSTSDGGNSWQQIESGTVENLNAINFLTETNAWIAANKGILLNSTDKGLTWRKVIPDPFNSTNYRSIAMSGFISCVCGDGNSIYTSTNKGTKWVKEYSFNNVDFTKVFSYWDGRRGMLLGRNGVIQQYLVQFRSITFFDKSPFSEYSYLNLFFTDVKHGWIVGEDGIILKTTTKDNKFFFAAQLDVNRLNSIHFIDTLNGMTVGSGGSLFKTLDGGTNWTRNDIGITNMLNKIFFIDSTTGWIIGSDGLIMKTTNYGGSIISTVGEKNSFPEEFVLNQNYPNPFNPSTTISFTLPERTNVTLKVYNVLGKEVAALINEVQNEGKHSINFDASGLSSGIYFYELRTEDKVFTKKMTLLK